MGQQKEMELLTESHNRSAKHGRLKNMIQILLPLIDVTHINSLSTFHLQGWVY